MVSCTSDDISQSNVIEQLSTFSKVADLRISRRFVRTLPMRTMKVSLFENESDRVPDQMIFKIEKSAFG